MTLEEDLQTMFADIGFCLNRLNVAKGKLIQMSALLNLDWIDLTKAQAYIDDKKTKIADIKTACQNLTA